MRVALVRPGELGETEIAAWQSMQRATPSLANPFLSAEFAVAAGHFRARSRVAVLVDGQSIAGFFPFERRGLGLAVPIGGWLSSGQGLVHAPGAEWDAAHLLRGCRLSAWQFDNLIAGQPFERFHAGAVQSPIIDLADGFESYYAKIMVRSRRFCRELARKANKLGREAGELRTIADCRDTAVLRTLMAWKSEQYRRARQVDRFAQPGVAGLLDALMATRTDLVSGRLSALYAGERPVAAQFGLRSGSLLVGWFTAYDPCFRKYSPGLIHLLQMAEELAATGVDAIYMGKGISAFKEVMKNSSVVVGEGIVTARSPVGTAHRLRYAASQWAAHGVRQHRGLHDAADHILRGSGIARRTYGRI